ncbi:MAG: hypothetical protein ACRDHL_04085, partial [Candidatus Promineifilaceae bacterium]
MLLLLAQLAYAVPAAAQSPPPPPLALSLSGPPGPLAAGDEVGGECHGLFCNNYEADGSLAPGGGDDLD